MQVTATKVGQERSNIQCHISRGVSELSSVDPQERRLGTGVWIHLLVRLLGGKETLNDLCDPPGYN